MQPSQPSAEKNNCSSGFALNRVRDRSVAMIHDCAIEVFATEDPKLRNQYYNLRHRIYRSEYDMQNYDGLESHFDVEGKTVVATHNGRVIGGVRVMFSDECKFLSNEVPGTQFEYRKLIKRYDDREDLIINETSSLVVEEGYRDLNVTAQLFDVAFDLAKKHGCHYIFAVAPAVSCRSYRITTKKIGYDFEIVINYPWKERKAYNFSRDFPMYTKLK